MKITSHKSNIRTVMLDDPDFKMIDGFTVVPRAGFYMSAECPQGYRQVINECVRLGWLQPVAHMRDYELMWDKLHD